jgi:hypothetical protein
MSMQPPTTTTRHPGDAARSHSGRDPAMDDEIRRSLVEQYQAALMEQARTDRLAHARAFRGQPTTLRARVGRALIGLGTSIAGGEERVPADRLA